MDFLHYYCFLFCVPLAISLAGICTFGLPQLNFWSSKVQDSLGNPCRIFSTFAQT